ncbi:MAG: type II toxin-antitoxin system VapC family toxin, partial [Deltaproteobacteria bacterium]|nr:type II toxin-antitoxin system VapC family toxin [Deltaproteobacteria bacterium]
FADFRRLHILSYTVQAEALYQEWRQQGVRLGTHDLRIAAICVAYSATLISRNRRDFERVPGLVAEFWE